MDLASVVAALASVGVRVSGSTPNSSVQVDSSRACPTGLAGPEPSGTFHDPGQHFQLDFDLLGGTPSGFTLGGRACLGRQATCAGEEGPKVEALVYVRAGRIPQDNFFVAMVSQLTVQDLLDVLGEFLGGSTPPLPLPVAESGIYPFVEGGPCGDEQGAGTGTASTDLNSACFARFSFSPLKAQQLEFKGGPLTVPAGVAASGRLKFLGWQMALEAEVSSTHFRIDAQMDLVAVRIGDMDVMCIGKELVDGAVQGGARFLVEFNAAATSARVEVHGAFEIPLLRANGQLAITLNADHFAMTGLVDFFAGALSAAATLVWD